jgi:hypothetical protein
MSDTKETPQRFYTTAPVDYDWGWTTEIITNVAVTDRGKVMRLVEIEDAYHANCQTGRYSSGLHAAWTQEQYDDQVRRGWITPTPDKAIYHFRRDFDMRPAIDDDSKHEPMLAIIHGSKTGGYTFESSGGMHYRLIVTGPKEEAERKFADLSAKITGILA